VRDVKLLQSRFKSLRVEPKFRFDVYVGDFPVDSSLGSQTHDSGGVVVGEHHVVESDGYGDFQVSGVGAVFNQDVSSTVHRGDVRQPTVGQVKIAVVGDDQGLEETV
jgi:hypothetical protein